MTEAEELSLLIGRIYDTTLDAALWPATLKTLSVFIGGCASSLYAKDTIGRSGSIFYDDGGIAKEQVDLYFAKYAKNDPSTIAQFCFELEEPFCTIDMMPHHEFAETRFYKEWAKPQNLVDHIAALLDKSSTGMALFGVFRHARDGLAVDETRGRMRLVVPHIRRAMLIGRLIGQKSAEAALLADSIDGLAAGIFLIDSERRVAHANAAGLALIAADDVVHAEDGKLFLRDAELSHTLRDVLTAKGNGDSVIGARSVASAIMARSGTAYSAHILPLSSGARRMAGAGYKAAAAVFIHKAELETRAPAEVIARTWKLTPAELRVLLAIVEVGGVPEVALALGIAETTVKTHLGHLYAKTGTGRQADLTKLVAGFSSPLAD